jgi:N-acetylglutamate synthase-like GNAT family acetyltransferase
MLRPATAQDFPAIRQLIRQVRINPTGLDWRHFIVAVDHDNLLLGCGQLKPHRGGTVELASIAVKPGARQAGVARAIIEHLIAAGPRPLYLTCRSSLRTFYEKWQFHVVEVGEMPPYYRSVARAAALFGKLFMPDERLLVMVLK